MAAQMPSPPLRKGGSPPPTDDCHSEGTRGSKGGQLPRVSCRLGTGVSQDRGRRGQGDHECERVQRVRDVHSQRDTAEIPRFIEEAADHVFHHDHPEGGAYGAIEAQSALALAHCSSARILDGQRAALWDPTAPSVEMHLSVADLEVLAETRGLKWFSLKTVTADTVLPIDGSEAYVELHSLRDQAGAPHRDGIVA